jgi:putative ABC transport system permease protein
VEIIRNLVQRRIRSSLAIGGVAVGVLVLTLTGAIAEHFEAQLGGGVAYYSRSIQVADDAGSAAGLVSLTKVAAIQAMPGVAAALPSVSLLARPGTIVGTPLGLPDTIVYRDPAEQKYSPIKLRLAAGHDLDAGKQGEVVLGADIATELKLKVGDTIGLPVQPAIANPDFVNHPFKVVGILRRTNTLPDATASVTLLDAQMLLQESLPASFRDRVDPSSLATSITVYGKPGTNLDRLADEISTKVSGVAATRPSDYVAGFDQGARFSAIAVGAAVLAILFGGLVLIDALLAAVADREREIALKMTFGARTWHIVAEYVVEATLLGLLGGVIGLGLGIGLAELLDLAGRSVSFDVFLVTDRLIKGALALPVVLGAAAGVLPALRASRVDPDLTLRAA